MKSMFILYKIVNILVESEVKSGEKQQENENLNEIQEKYTH